MDLVSSQFSFGYTKTSVVCPDPSLALRFIRSRRRGLFTSVIMDKGTRPPRYSFLVPLQSKFFINKGGTSRLGWSKVPKTRPQVFALSSIPVSPPCVGSSGSSRSGPSYSCPLRVGFGGYGVIGSQGNPRRRIRLSYLFWPGRSKNQNDQRRNVSPPWSRWG